VFAAGVQALTTISTVRHGFVGSPATTDRPVIERSYSVALTVVFDDLAGHDAYQADAIHLRFLEQCRTFWQRVQIYDSDTSR